MYVVVIILVVTLDDVIKPQKARLINAGTPLRLASGSLYLHVVLAAVRNAICPNDQLLSFVTHLL